VGDFLSLDFSHWIRGYLYDTDGNPMGGATVTASNVSGVSNETVTTTTTPSGYYQLNIQSIANEYDLIKIRFTQDEVPIGAPPIIEEFIRVQVNDLTQEVNATFQNQFQITCNLFTIYLPYIKWDGVNGKINKDVTIFNFKNNTVDTIDKGINNEPFTIEGWIWVDVYTRDTISGKVEAFIHMQNEHQEITIHDVNSTLDGTYVIKKFKFDSVKKSPYLFKWKFQLEYVGD
jgi:hypothetical protein